MLTVDTIGRDHVSPRSDHCSQWDSTLALSSPTFSLLTVTVVSYVPLGMHTVYNPQGPGDQSLWLTGWSIIVVLKSRSVLEVKRGTSIFSGPMDCFGGYTYQLIIVNIHTKPIYMMLPLTQNPFLNSLVSQHYSLVSTNLIDCIMF